MEALKQKIQRLVALVKVEELSVQEVQTQWVQINLQIEGVEKHQKQLQSQIDLIQLQVRQAMGGEAFLDLQSHLVQQKKMQKFESHLNVINDQHVQLADQRDQIEQRLCELRSKVKGFKRMISRYKNEMIETEQKAEDKAQDGLITMRAGRAMYG